MICGNVLKSGIASFSVIAAAAMLSCMPSWAASDTSVPGGQQHYQQAREIHQNNVILDGHADIVLPTTSKTYLGSDGLSKVAPGKLKAGMVNAVIMSVAVGPGPRTEAGDAAARALAERGRCASSPV